MLQSVPAGRNVKRTLQVTSGARRPQDISGSTSVARKAVSTNRNALGMEQLETVTAVINRFCLRDGCGAGCGCDVTQGTPQRRAALDDMHSPSAWEHPDGTIDLKATKRPRHEDLD
jgi:hypothetical protein